MDVLLPSCELSKKDFDNDPYAERHFVRKQSYVEKADDAMLCVSKSGQDRKVGRDKRY